MKGCAVHLNTHHFFNAVETQPLSQNFMSSLCKSATFYPPSPTHLGERRGNIERRCKKERRRRVRLRAGYHILRPDDRMSRRETEVEGRMGVEAF